MNREFRLLMIGAMYENGGNTTHRFLDGHPQLLVYPFESQLGTRTSATGSPRMFPAQVPLAGVRARRRRPRWTTRRSSTRSAKVRGRTPHVSKFRDEPSSTSTTTSAAPLLLELVDARGARARPTSRRSSVPRFDVWRERAPQRRGDDLRRLQPGRRRRRREDPGRAPGRPLPPRRAQPLVGLRRHQEAAAAAVAGRLHAALVAQPVLRLAQLAPAYPERVHILRIEDVDGGPGGTLGGLLASLGLSARRHLRRRAGTDSRSRRSTRGARCARSPRRPTGPRPQS